MWLVQFVVVVVAEIEHTLSLTASLFIHAQLSTKTVSALQKVWVQIKPWKQHSITVYIYICVCVCVCMCVCKHGVHPPQVKYEFCLKRSDSDSTRDGVSCVDSYK